MSSFLPLHEINHGDEVDGVAFRLALPDYAPTESILLNASRIGRIAHWGGIRGVVVSTYSGDVTTHTPEISGISGSGTATASYKVATQKALTMEALIAFQDGHNSTPPAYDWAQARIKLNKEEIEDSIVRSNGSVHDPQEWSKRIDRDLRAGLRDAARQHLLARQNRTEFLMMNSLSLAVGSLYSAVTGTYGELDVATKCGVGFGVINTLGQIFDAFLCSDGGYHVSERRKSLFTGLQLDRLLVAASLSRTLHLAKAADVKDADVLPAT